MNLDKLDKLTKLKDSGVITEEEYNKGKKEAMEENGMTQIFKKAKFGLTSKNYLVLMHVSQYFSFVVPLLGIIAPIVLWVMEKDNDPLVDSHGKNILNWNISLLIYFAICAFLMFLFIGFLLIWIPCILMIIYPAIGAIKASNEEDWKYPLSIKFL